MDNNNKAMTSKEKSGLGLNYQIAIISLFVLVMCVNFFWVYSVQRAEVIEIALEKADIIVKNFRAAIEFSTKSIIENKKEGIETVETIVAHQRVLSVGEAAKEFGEFIELSTNFKIRLISDQARNKNNSPNAYEESALKSFIKNPDLENIYKEEYSNNKRVFRYLVPLKITQDCLACHGEPKGELDITGHKKEGYKLGEIRGAINLTMPMDTEYKYFKKQMISIVTFYFFLTLGGVAVFSIILKKMINLNKEIHNKNVQLKNQQDALKEYEAEKYRLTEMIVHDLKNPLSVIMSGLEMLSDSNLVVDPKTSVIMSIANSNVKRLSNMISDILDVNAMESKRFTPKYEVIDFKTYVTGFFDELRITLKSKIKSLDIIFKNEVLPFVVDVNLLKRIFENIIFNAITHSPSKEAEITVAIEYISERDELLIGVSDKGEGIPKEYLDKIFDMFFQVSGKYRSSLNKGLGLTFCKFAINLMGGKIWAESELNKGTTFYFTLKNGEENGFEKGKSDT